MPTSLQQIAASLRKVEAHAQRVESLLKLVIANQKKILAEDGNKEEEGDSELSTLVMDFATRHPNSRGKEPKTGKKRAAAIAIPTADEIEARKARRREKNREYKRAQYARDKKSGKNRNAKTPAEQLERTREIRRRSYWKAKSPEQLERRREISRQSSAKHRMKKQMEFEARVEIDKNKSIQI